MNMEHENVWFEQDGATTHKSRRSLGILRCFLGVLSPCVVTTDLTPCDLFLWGYLKA
jgi:hypothetical protein